MDLIESYLLKMTRGGDISRLAFKAVNRLQEALRSMPRGLLKRFFFKRRLSSAAKELASLCPSFNPEAYWPANR